MQPLQDFSLQKNASLNNSNSGRAIQQSGGEAANPFDRTDVSSSFKAEPQRASTRSPDFYFGFRTTSGQTARIEATAAGFSFEQLISIKASYALVRDAMLKASPRAAKIELALHPLEGLSWNPQQDRSTILLAVDRGVIVQLPQTFPAHEAIYRKIISDWTQTILAIAKNRKKLWPEFRFEPVSCGRIDSIASRKDLPGAVLAVPQGGFDWNVAELVEELSFVTGLPAAIARGYTPAECGNARLNVSRPSERSHPDYGSERDSERSREVFGRYKKIAVGLARGSLDHYLELQENQTLAHIDVATVGVTTAQARAVKQSYYEIRERMLKSTPAIRKIDFFIEPNDIVEVAAADAKNTGLLKQAKRGLHFELPAKAMFSDDATRRGYTAVLAELIERIVQPSG